MKIITQKVTAELVEKKSKFICNLYYVESKEEAEKIIADTKRQYHDARHNCYAYLIYDAESKSIITKSSDDGEPSGTAGSPILNSLKANEMVNILAIVTRYFGGILLGTGGLVRAYKQASIMSIQNANLCNVEIGYLACIEVNYENNERFMHFCNRNNVNMVKSEYLTNIRYIIEINEEKKKKLELEMEHNVISFDIIQQKLIKSA